MLLARTRSLLLASLLVPLSGLGAEAATITSRFSVTGAVDRPGSYGAADLQPLPQQDRTVTFLAAGMPVTATFSGPTVWSVLGQAGLKAPAGVKNPSLRDVVVATGSDGYAVAFAGGELDPRFVGTKAPDLIGIAENGQPLGPDGFARTVVPGDARGGRYVSNLANLNVVQAPSNPLQGGGHSSSFTVSGVVRNAATYDLASLKALPSVTESVTYTSMGQPVSTAFTGVSLWSLLLAAHLVTDPAIKNDELRDYVLATGSDGYEAVFSLGELDPAFGGSMDRPDLVAFAENGIDLASDGFARLVVPGDSAGGRYVSKLVSLQVLSATAPAPVPLPGSLPLLAIGLVALGMARHRVRT